MAGVLLFFALSFHFEEPCRGAKSSLLRSLQFRGQYSDPSRSSAGAAGRAHAWAGRPSATRSTRVRLRSLLHPEGRARRVTSQGPWMWFTSQRLAWMVGTVSPGSRNTEESQSARPPPLSQPPHALPAASWPRGARVAHLTPDQKVVCSNHIGVKQVTVAPLSWCTLLGESVPPDRAVAFALSNPAQGPMSLLFLRKRSKGGPPHRTGRAAGTRATSQAGVEPAVF